MIIRLIYLSILIILAGSSFAEERRLALVIGNADYEYVSKLKNSVNDANDMAEKLELLGFDVLKYTNLSLDSMKFAVLEFGRRLKNYDIGLFFYAGHGIEMGGNNYFVAIDSDANSVEEVRMNTVPINALIAVMRLSNCKTKIIILDACRANPFPYSKEANSGGLALMDAPEGSIVCFSTSPGRTASDGLGKNGLYTEAILEHIMTPDIEIGEFFHKVRSDVLSKTKKEQIPWETTSLIEKFVFNVIPEMELISKVVEGSEAEFNGYGVIHAQSNIQDVSFQWFLNGESYGHGTSLEVNRSGYYHARGISPQGQQITTDSIFVTIKSLIDPKIRVREGSRIKFNGFGELHAQSNTMGQFFWYRGEQSVGQDPIVTISQSGDYNVEFRTHEDQLVSSEFIDVTVKRPSTIVFFENNDLHDLFGQRFQDDFSEICDVVFESYEGLDDQYLASLKEPYLILAYKDGSKQVSVTFDRNRFHTAIPLFVQAFGLYSKEEALNVSIVYARESDVGLVKLFEKYLSKEYTFVYSSDEDFELALKNRSGVMFFHSTKNIINQNDFQRKYNLHIINNIYSEHAENIVENGILTISSFLISNADPGSYSKIGEVIYQFMNVKDRLNLRLDYTNSCKSILSGSPLPVHEKLFYQLTPSNCN